MSFLHEVGKYTVREDISSITHHLKDAEVRDLLEHQLSARLRIESNGQVVAEVVETFVNHALKGQAPHGKPLADQAAEWRERHFRGLRLDGQRRTLGICGVGVELLFHWDKDEFLLVNVHIPEVGIDSTCTAREIVRAAKDWKDEKENFAGHLYPRIAVELQA